jgi:hypothetical protein
MVFPILAASIFTCSGLQGITNRIVQSVQLTEIQRVKLFQELKNEFPGCSLNGLPQMKSYNKNK